MASLEATLASAQEPLPDQSLARRQEALIERPRAASQAERARLDQRMTAAGFPPWLHEAVDDYLSWRWPTWRAQTAYQLGRNFINGIHRIWHWLAEHRHIEGWQTLRRADLAAWLKARSQDGVSNVTIGNQLGLLHSLLKFVAIWGRPLDPGLFRVQAPRKDGIALPRYLSERDYRC